ncbi:MAG: LuxR C-terminal-related transcriptional regulator [Cyclobacteriaceae bacterium]
MEKKLLQQDVRSARHGKDTGVVNRALLLMLEITEGRIGYVSESVQPLFGYCQSRIINQSIGFIKPLVYPRDCALLRQIYNRLIAEDQDSNLPLSWSQEFRVKHAQGHWLWVQGDFITGTRRGLTLEELYIHLRDVSQRKNQETWLSGEVLEKNSSPQDDHITHIYRRLSSFCHGRTDLNISPRESEVLQLIGQGLSTKQIAAELYISIHTAVSHRKNLIEKFKVKNTAELVKEATKYIWLE